MPHRKYVEKRDCIIIKFNRLQVEFVKTSSANDSLYKERKKFSRKGAGDLIAVKKQIQTRKNTPKLPKSIPLADRVKIHKEI